MKDYLIITVIQAILVAIGIYIYPYIRKKAENNATKEDIGKITKEIEVIRNMYGEKLETIKAKLSVFTSSEKWFISYQNKILLDNLNELLDILHIFKTIPNLAHLKPPSKEKKDLSDNEADEYWKLLCNIRDKYGKNLRLVDDLRLWIGDNDTIYKALYSLLDKMSIIREKYINTLTNIIETLKSNNIEKDNKVTELIKQYRTDINTIFKSEEFDKVLKKSFSTIRKYFRDSSR